MNLYEINRNIEDVMSAMIDQETGEVDEKFADELDRLNIEKSEKVESIACGIKNLTAYAEALKTEKASITLRQQRAEKKIESLKQYLLDSLQGEKFKSVKAEIGYRKSQVVTLTGDESEIINNLKISNPSCVNAKYTLNKIAIKDLLKNGESIYGAILTDNTSIQIK